MTEAMEISGVSKSFGGLNALTDVNCSMADGRITAVIGPNGAGKTTLFNCVSGLLKPDSGRVRLLGQDISAMPPWKRASLGIARTFQNLQLFRHMTVVENVMLGGYRLAQRNPWLQAMLWTSATAEGRLRYQEAMEQLEVVGLAEKALESVDGLSFGQQRLLEIARALMMRPRILFLDEAASGLTFAEKAKLAEHVASLPARGVSVVLIEHDMALAMGLSDRVVVLNQGKVLAIGTPEEIQSNQAVIDAYLGRHTGGDVA